MSKHIWGRTLFSQQMLWATKEIDNIAMNLNEKNIRSSLKQSVRSKPTALRLSPDGGFEDPLFAERNVRRYGSDIYFLDVIDDETQLILQVMLKQAQAEFWSDHVQDILTHTLSDAITIHLNSPGGYAYCGLALYDFIKQMKQQVPITCIVEGSCASAATLIFLACEERKMLDSSVFLMHQCSWGGYGEDRYMQDEAENSRKLMSRLRKIYMEETDIGIEFEDALERESYIHNEILSHDRYFSKEECEKLGIIRSKDEEDSPLSEESIAKLNEFAEKLFEEEQKLKDKSAKKATKSAKSTEAEETKKPEKKPVKKTKEESPKKPTKKTTEKTKKTDKLDPPTRKTIK